MGQIKQPEFTQEIRKATKQHPEEMIDRKLKENEKVRRAVDAYIKETKQRTYKFYTNRSLRFIGEVGPKGLPANAYWPRNNSRMDIYLDDNMELGWEVIQRIDEVKKDFTPNWQSLNPEAVLLHTLRKNDEVEIWHDIKRPIEERKRILVRVQKMSPGDIVFFPVEISSGSDASPWKIRIKSLKKFKELQLTRVIRNAIGSEIFRSRRRNR